MTLTAHKRIEPFAIVAALFALLAALAAPSARAQLSIEITTEGGQTRSIAVVPFAEEARLPQSVTGVVGDDLKRSGLFRIDQAAASDPQPHDLPDVDFGVWKDRLADFLLIGAVTPLPDGRFTLRFKLLDVPRTTQLVALSYTVRAVELRSTAHRIADVIFEQITGERGVFSSRIAYVVKGAGGYRLEVADADGQGQQTAYASTEPIMSPSWSPDGTRLAYVSFELGRASVVVQTLATGKRLAVANFKGTNSAPAWSPDGRHLCVTLSKEGGSQLFDVDLMRSGKLTRLTTGGAIDTEASYSPDGKWIAFASDRGGIGSPQLYRIPAQGGNAERLTFSGNYNISPHYSNDGTKLAYIEREGAFYRVVLMDLETRQIQRLTDGGQDQSPTFAPNDRAILYSTQNKGRGALATVSTDGRIRQRITSATGDVREAAWGPL